MKEKDIVGALNYAEQIRHYLEIGVLPRHVDAPAVINLAQFIVDVAAATGTAREKLLSMIPAGIYNATSEPNA